MLRRMVLNSESPAAGKGDTRETSQQPEASASDIQAVLVELNRAQVGHLSPEEGEQLLARGLRLRRRCYGKQREALTKLMNRLARHLHGGGGFYEAISDLVSNDRKLQAAAASSWGIIAERATRRGDWEFATEAMDNSVELLRILVAAENAHIRRDVAKGWCRWCLDDLLPAMASGAPVSARRSLVTLMISRLLDAARDFPHDVDLKTTVANVRFMAADLAMAQGD